MSGFLAWWASVCLLVAGFALELGGGGRACAGIVCFAAAWWAYWMRLAR